MQLNTKPFNQHDKALPERYNLALNFLIDSIDKTVDSRQKELSGELESQIGKDLDVNKAVIHFAAVFLLIYMLPVNYI